MIDDSRNIYGDSLNEGVAGRGVDIALQRTDDLDNAAIAYIQNLESPTVLDFGCGAGGQSLRMAQAGGRVLGVDMFDFSDTFSSLPGYGDTLAFQLGDVRHIIKDLAFFDVGFSQRTIHYMPYAEALDLLAMLRQKVSGKLFLSATGLKTEVGDGYPDKDKPVKDRFCAPAAEMAEKHKMYEPVCLYTLDEFCQLLAQAGWKVESAHESTFRNLKTISSAE